MIEASASRTLIGIYSLFRAESLSTIIKLILHKSLIRSVITYVCPAWKLAAHTYFFKLQHLQRQGLSPSEGGGGWNLLFFFFLASLVSVVECKCRHVRMNTELEEIWKEVIIAQLMYYPGMCLEGPPETRR
jgi:hypothetical protein